MCCPDHASTLARRHLEAKIGPHEGAKTIVAIHLSKIVCPLLHHHESVEGVIRQLHPEIVLLLESRLAIIDLLETRLSTPPFGWIACSSVLIIGCLAAHQAQHVSALGLMAMTTWTRT